MPHTARRQSVTDERNMTEVMTAAEEFAAQEQADYDRLNGIVEATESAITLRDFEPAKIQAAASFDLSAADGQRKWIQAQNGRHLDLIDLGESVQTVTDWVCWQKDVTRPSGEVEHDAWVCCMWLAGKGCVSFASALTIQQWAAFARAIRGGKIALPLKVAFVANPSKIKGGNPWYSILPVEE